MRSHKKTNVLLWTLQAFLALFIGLASGAPKLLLPVEAIPMPIPLSSDLMHFIGVCEVLGALGLILPGATRIRPGMTSVAALALVALTICATVYQLMGGWTESAVFASVMGLLFALVAYGRWRLAPITPRAAYRETPALAAA